MAQKLFKVFAIVGVLFVSACSDNGTSSASNEEKMQEVKEVARDIVGNNAFLYYKDYAEATNFYGNIMGFSVVFEFEGFASIYRTSPTTFITVVNDNGRGMHTSEEPKTIAIAFVTDQVEEWYEYALSQNMEIRNPFKPLGERPYHGFIAVDPGGYFLEFEHFADHPENVKMTPLFKKDQALYPEEGADVSRPSDLGFYASIYWLYHEDKQKAADFYSNVMGLEKLVEQSFSDIYASSPTGFIGLVESGKGMHTATHDKAVNIGFLTSNSQAWFDHLKDEPTFKLRTQELFHEEDEEGNNLIDIVIGYDPENYYIEIDQFIDVERNKKIRQAVGLD